MQAARHGYEDIVDLLVEAGARLGGFDVEGGYVTLAVQTALRTHDERMLHAWKKTGINLAELNSLNIG
jgi:lysophospholipase